MIIRVDLAQESPGIFYGNAFARGRQSASYDLTLKNHDGKMYCDLLATDSENDINVGSNIFQLFP